MCIYACVDLVYAGVYSSACVHACVGGGSAFIKAISVSASTWWHWAVVFALCCINWLELTISLDQHEQEYGVLFDGTTQVSMLHAKQFPR